MADEPRKIIVDDDWKAQARREKEILTEKTEAKHEPPPIEATMFLELVNLLSMQAMVGLGMVQGPGGERIPPNLPAAKHFIDLLSVLDEKTKGNLSPDEKKVLDQLIYEMRMIYVQVSSALAGMAAPGAPPGPAAPRGGPAGPAGAGGAIHGT